MKLRYPKASGGRNRTSYTWIYSPVLYQLSYVRANYGDRTRSSGLSVRRSTLEPNRLEVPDPVGIGGGLDTRWAHYGRRARRPGFTNPVHGALPKVPKEFGLPFGAIMYGGMMSSVLLLLDRGSIGAGRPQVPFRPVSIRGPSWVGMVCLISPSSCLAFHEPTRQPSGAAVNSLLVGQGQAKPGVAVQERP